MPFGWYVFVDNFSFAKIALIKNLENTLQRKQDVHTNTCTINILQACNLNTLAANKQSQDQRKHVEISIYCPN